MAGGSGLLSAIGRGSGASTLTTPQKKGKAKAAAPPQHASKQAASPPCKLAKGGPQIEAKRAPLRSECAPASVAKTQGRTSFAVKHAGKTPHDILDPTGLADIKTAAEEVLAALCGPPFTTALLGENYIAFKDSCTQLKKKMSTVQKNVVNLDVKVKKWKDIPDGVGPMMKLWRNKVLTIQDSLVQFDVTSNKDGDASKMENCMACMASYSIDLPNAMQILFFREKSADLARFGMVDELVEFMHVQEGQLCDLHSKDLSSDLDSVYAEVIAECLAVLLSSNAKDLKKQRACSKTSQGSCPEMRWASSPLLARSWQSLPLHLVMESIPRRTTVQPSLPSSRKSRMVRTMPVC
jgi:hypothetical protein